MKRKLCRLCKKHYAVNDRCVLTFQPTDYYIPMSPCGNIKIKIGGGTFRVCKHCADDLGKRINKKFKL